MVAGIEAKVPVSACGSCGWYERGVGGGWQGGATYGLAKDTGIVSNACGVHTDFSPSVIYSSVAQGEKSMLDELPGCEGECGGICWGYAELEGVEERRMREESAGLWSNEVGEPGVRVDFSGDDV